MGELQRSVLRDVTLGVSHRAVPSCQPHCQYFRGHLRSWASLAPLGPHAPSVDITCYMKSWLSTIAQHQEGTQGLKQVKCVSQGKEREPHWRAHWERHRWEETWKLAMTNCLGYPVHNKHSDADSTTYCCEHENISNLGDKSNPTGHPRFKLSFTADVPSQHSWQEWTRSQTLGAYWNHTPFQGLRIQSWSKKSPCSHGAYVLRETMETRKKIHNMSGGDERREVKEDKVEKNKIK